VSLMMPLMARRSARTLIAKGEAKPPLKPQLKPPAKRPPFQD